MVSIIISYHNEERHFLLECIGQIVSTIDVPEYEIVVVDDASHTPLQAIDGVRVIRHEENRGVGTAFDTGVEHAKHENIILMANDIRFLDNGWASELLKEIEAHPKAFTCTTCVTLGQNRLTEEFTLDIQSQIYKGKYSQGATIKMFSDKNNSAHKSDAFRSVIDAQWLPNGTATTTADSYEVPCILGAIYGVKKSWYNEIEGWAGHKQWGTLEPYISIKSWLLGGSCRVAPRVVIGHIYKLQNPHGAGQRVILWNKYLTATLFIPNHMDYINWMKQKYVNPTTDQWMQEKKEWLDKKRVEYAQKTKLSFDEYCKKFDIEPLILTDKDVGLTGAKEEEAEYYDAIFMQHPSNLRYQAIYKKVSEVAGNRRVLDIGCGSAKLREHIENYRGFDFIPKMVKHLQDEGADVWIGDIHDRSNFVDADLYVSIEVLEHILKDLVVVENIPHGKDVVISVPSFGGRGHVRVYTEETARDRYKGLLDIHKVTYFVWKDGAWTESDTLTTPFILFIEATRI